MTGLSLAALIGVFAFVNARMEGSREALLGWGFVLVLATAYVLANELGIDFPAVFSSLTRSATTLIIVVLAAIGIGGAAGLLARWSLRFNLSPARVGLVFFGASLLLINLWAFFHRIREQT